MGRKTSCYGSCYFHHDQHVLGCQGWTEHGELFPQPKPAPGPQLRHRHQVEKYAKTLTFRSSRPDHGFESIVGEDQRGVQDGTVRVNSFHPMVAIMNRYRSSCIMSLYRTPPEEAPEEGSGLRILWPLIFTMLLMTVS